MLRAVGEPRRIERAIKRLQGALKGIPSRGVRLTWRGGELRTTIHWVRDDAFWWAVEPRHQRDALVLGHAPDPPARRESITCEINLPRAGSDRKVAGINLYANEIPLLFESRSAMVDDVYGYGARMALAGRVSGYAERYWATTEE